MPELGACPRRTACPGWAALPIGALTSGGLLVSGEEGSVLGRLRANGGNSSGAKLRGTRCMFTGNATTDAAPIAQTNTRPTHARLRGHLPGSNNGVLCPPRTPTLAQPSFFPPNCKVVHPAGAPTYAFLPMTTIVEVVHPAGAPTLHERRTPLAKVSMWERYLASRGAPQHSLGRAGTVFRLERWVWSLFHLAKRNAVPTPVGHERHPPRKAEYRSQAGRTGTPMGHVSI